MDIYAVGVITYEMYESLFMTCLTLVLPANVRSQRISTRIRTNEEYRLPRYAHEDVPIQPWIS